VADTARHDCADESVTYDYDRAANFSNYKTYAWTRGTELSDAMNHARVIRAIEAAVVAKGLARVEPSANPDVLVAYHPSFDSNLEITGSAHGWGPFGLGADQWGRRGFSPFWSERLSSTSPMHGHARSCGGVWRAVTSGPPTTGKSRQEDREGDKEDVQELPAEAITTERDSRAPILDSENPASHGF
jgi:hypothetical protein